MALSGEVKLRVLYHLCYPATTLTVGNVNFHSVVRDRLDISDALICNEIEAIVDCLDEADLDIKAAKKCLKVEKVADITMNKDNIRNCKNEYARLTKKLSCSLDIPSRNCNSSVRVVL